MVFRNFSRLEFVNGRLFPPPLPQAHMRGDRRIILSRKELIALCVQAFWLRQPIYFQEFAGTIFLPTFMEEGQVRYGHIDKSLTPFEVYKLNKLQKAWQEEDGEDEDESEE